MSVPDQPAGPGRRGLSVVSVRVMQDPDVSVAAKALYGLLCTYADGDGVCWPGIETLASRLGVTERSVRNWLGELLALGLIERTRRYGRQQTSTLTVLMDLQVKGYRNVRSSTSGHEDSPRSRNPSADELIQRELDQREVPPYPPPTAVEQPRSSSDEEPEGFAEWWALYPRKVGKGAARSAYRKAIKGITPPALLQALRGQLEGLERARLEGSRKGADYRPMPASWLNNERWADEPADSRAEESIFDHQYRIEKEQP